MPEVHSSAKFWLITAIMAGIIVYGSFYPFNFRVPPYGDGPVAAFLASIHRPPGRGDAIANILLYMPLGFFCVLGAPRTTRLTGVALAMIGGMALSLCVELGQYYDAGRTVGFTDFAANSMGTLLGALFALAIGASLRLPFIGDASARPAPTLLLVAWLAYRLYPYVPTIDLHKYWNALKPVLLTPSLTGYDLFRQAAIWLTVYALIEAIVRRRRSAFLAPLFACAVLAAKVAIVGMILKLSDPIGAAVAYIAWLLLLLPPSRARSGIAGVVLGAYIAALRLEPFTFVDVAHKFQWIPFAGLMQGSVRANTLALLEKFFLYGSMVYLLGMALGRMLPAALFTAAALFVTSWAETWLPGRSSEIADALIALIAAMIFTLLPADQEAAQVTRKLSTRERRLRDWQRAQARELGVQFAESGDAPSPTPRGREITN